MLKLRQSIFLLVVAVVLSVASGSAFASFQLQSSNNIPVFNEYVHQTYSMEDVQGKLAFGNLTLDPRFEGFLTVWTRGDARRIIVHMNPRLIEVQVEGTDIRTVLQQPASGTFSGGFDVEVVDGRAVIRLGGASFTVNGVTALAGKIDAIGISGNYQYFKWVLGRSGLPTTEPPSGFSRPAGSYDIPVSREYVYQTYSSGDISDVMVDLTRLTLDPAFEGFVTLWTRGEVRRIIIHMNRAVIEVQAEGARMETVLQDRMSGLTYAGGCKVAVGGNQAQITLGGRSYTVNGVSALAGRLDSIGVSGHYDLFSR